MKTTFSLEIKQRMWSTARELDTQSKGSEVNPRRRVGRTCLAERCSDLEDSIGKSGKPAGAQAQGSPSSQTTSL